MAHLLRLQLLSCLICLTSVLPACSQPTPSPSIASGQQDSPAGEASAASIELVSAGDGSWPRLLGATYDGAANSAGLEFDWSRAPQRVWRLPVGEGYGLGSLHQGRYLHVDASGGQERLRSIDAATGKTVWSVQRPCSYADLYGYENGPRGTPTIAGDSVVTLGVDGGLSCRRLSDGKLIWSVDTNKQYGVVQNFFGVGSSPLIHDGKVIVQIGGSPPEDQSIAPGRLDRVIPNGSALVAFDLQTGKETWRCGVDLASYSSPRLATIDSKEVVLLLARDHFMMVDPAVGKVLWKVRHRAEILESVNAMIPVVKDDLVFISECYRIGSRLMKVTLKGETTLWDDASKSSRMQSMRCHWSTPILIDGYLYGCSGRNNPDSDFRCVEFETGRVMWDDGRRMRSSVVKVGDHLVVLEEQGLVQIVKPNPKELTVVAEYDFGDQISYPCWAAPIVVGNQMLIRGDRNVLCLALPIK